jgi:mRNA interferase MazF
MAVKQFEVWLADLSPQIGTEAGKKRPVVIVQTDLLNQIPHPSSIVCPITTRVRKQADVLRVHLRKGMANLHQDYDILVEQLRAIDNRRLIRKFGAMPSTLDSTLKENLKIILDLE